MDSCSNVALFPFGKVALLRLLRLLRVILIYKKVSASRLKMKQSGARFFASISLGSAGFN